MDEELEEAAHAYLHPRNKRIGRRLGAGIHGSVWSVKSETNSVETALKVHRFADAFRRERDVYDRLADNGIDVILGFVVPTMLAAIASTLRLS